MKTRGILRAATHLSGPVGGVNGFSLIEVMIAMFVLAVGLLGLAGLQARAMNAEYESYARGKALFLLEDLADRMVSNTVEVKATAAANTAYNQGNGTGVVTVTPTLRTFGTGTTVTCTSAACCNTATADIDGNGTVIRSERDLCEWHVALRDSASSGGSAVGAMPGIRGCVFLRDATTREYQIDVVWQGRETGATAPAGVTCGAAALSVRRNGVSRRIRFADLDGA